MTLIFKKLKETVLAPKARFCSAMNILESMLNFIKLKPALQGYHFVMHFDSSKDDEYVTVSQLSERYPAFTQGSIRWLIFNMDNNGFKKVVRKIGRKVILNMREFRNFLEEQTQR